VSKLREKAINNFEASKLLIENSIFAPSVHCAYYGCFQLIMFILKDFFGKDYDIQNREIKELKENSHNYRINFITKQINNLEKDIKVSREFDRTIKQLKQLRVVSDYHDVEIDHEKSTKALEYANFCQSYLNKQFI